MVTVRHVAAGGLTLLLAAAPRAEAHPHVFIDGGVDFLFDEGRLTAIRVTWVYDPFASLFIVEELGLDADGDGALTASDHATLVRDQTRWPEGYEGDNYLRVDGELVALEAPGNGTAALVDGRVRVTFERALAEPVPARGLRALAQLYDPTYFYAYAVEETPALEGAPAGCEAAVHPYGETEELAGLQQTLAQLSREETPDYENVGALFADRIVLTCG